MNRTAKKVKAVQAAAVAAGPIKVASNEKMQLRLHVKPGAKQSQIVSIDDTSIGLQELDRQIAAPPREGEANEEVTRVMSELLGVKRRQVELVAGHRSRDKCIQVELDPSDMRSPQSVLASLTSLIKKSPNC